MPIYSGFPQYYDKCKDVYIWSNGKKYLDMSFMGMSCLLGYGNKHVNNAVKKAIEKGVICSLNNPDEEILADMLTDIYMPGGLVRYAKTGGEAIWIACKLANIRNKTILRQGYNGHIVESMNCKKFNYNDIESFESQIDENIGCVIVEELRDKVPDLYYFEVVRRECNKRNIPVILDCISSGFRCYGNVIRMILHPDIIVLGKCIANGYPLSAIIGKEKIINNKDVFISSNNFTESIGISAAIATIKEYYKIDFEYIYQLGCKIQNIWNKYAVKYDIDIDLNYVPELSHFEFKDQERKMAYKTIFTKIFLENGIIATNSFYPSFAHKEKHVKQYDKICDRAFEIISIWKNRPEELCKINGWNIIQERPIRIT